MNKKVKIQLEQFNMKDNLLNQMIKAITVDQFHQMQLKQVKEQELLHNNLDPKWMKTSAKSKD